MAILYIFHGIVLTGTTWSDQYDRHNSSLYVQRGWNIGQGRHKVFLSRTRNNVYGTKVCKAPPPLNIDVRVAKHDDCGSETGYTVVRVEQYTCEVNRYIVADVSIGE